MKWATKLLFVRFLLICFPCCEAWNQQQRSLGSLILVYFYVYFLLLLFMLRGLTPSTHENITMLHCVPHSTTIAHIPCHPHILEWSMRFLLHLFIKFILEFLWRIELKCVYKTMCDMWMKSTLGYISKDNVTCVFTKMWNEPRMWGWNLKPSHIQWGTKKWQIA
jgi:hypothetical protein